MTTQDESGPLKRFFDRFRVQVPEYTADGEVIPGTENTRTGPLSRILDFYTKDSGKPAWGKIAGSAVGALALLQALRGDDDETVGPPSLNPAMTEPAVMHRLIRERLANPTDYSNYGKTGGEHDFYGEPVYGMSLGGRLKKFAKKVVSFERENLRNIGKGIKDDPKRLLVGAVDPFSTKVWNKALGEKWDPLVNQMGGATDQSYARAAAKGIDIGPGKAMHDLAGVIAGTMAGGYGMSKLGALSQAGGIPGKVGQVYSKMAGPASSGGKFGKIMDYVGMASDIAGAFQQPGAPAAPDPGTSMGPLSSTARSLNMPSNLTRYGKVAGEHQFYSHGGASHVEGTGSGRDDTVEALLSDGEYVIDAESVALLGDGSLDEGARRLDQLRANLRKHKGAALAKGQFSPDAKAPEQYMAMAKGGKTRGPKLIVDNTERPVDNRQAQLDHLRRMLRAHQQKDFPKPGEDLGGDPYNRRGPKVRKARGGGIDLKAARDRVASIQKMAKETPYKKGDAVDMLKEFANRLEATIERPEEAAKVELEMREFAKGGSVLSNAQLVNSILEKYRPTEGRTRSPEELRQMAEALRRLKPNSEVLRQVESAQQPRVYRPSEMRRKVQ